MFHFQSLRVGPRVGSRCTQGFMVLRKGPTGMSAGVPSVRGQVTREWHVARQNTGASLAQKWIYNPTWRKITIYIYIYIILRMWWTWSRNVIKGWNSQAIHTPEPCQNEGDPDRSMGMDHRTIHTRFFEPVPILNFFGTIGVSSGTHIFGVAASWPWRLRSSSSQMNNNTAGRGTQFLFSPWFMCPCPSHRPEARRKWLCEAILKISQVHQPPKRQEDVDECGKISEIDHDWRCWSVTIFLKRSNLWWPRNCPYQLTRLPKARANPSFQTLFSMK